MILKYGLIVSDVDELCFFPVGPFESKAEAKEFASEIAKCDILISVHPYIQVMNWMERVVMSPRTNREMLEAAALHEMRD